ncbi:MAG: hypothetical protein WAT99_07105, partial [Nitrospira sp.]
NTPAANGGLFGDGQAWCVTVRHCRLLKTPYRFVLSCSLPSPYDYRYDSGLARLAASLQGVLSNLFMIKADG